MKNDRVLSLLGIAAKSGNMASGEFQTEKAVKEAKAHLVIVAGDASDNTKKKFTNMCEYYQVPFLTYADREILGHSIGKEFRASVAIVDAGLADSVMKQLKSRITTE